MNLKHFARLKLNKRFLLIAAFAVVIVAAIAVVPQMERMLAPTHAQGFLGPSGTYFVQASGTAYFFTPHTNDPYGGQGKTEVLHVTIGGTATYSNSKNTAVNLTLNLGGQDDNSTQNNYNPLICNLTQPGDFFYTPPSGGAPATFTVTYQNGDSCSNPTGVAVNGGGASVSELGNLMPFNFYPGNILAGGLIVSNYTSLTTGGTGNNDYPHGWIDGGSTFYSPGTGDIAGTGSHVILGLSVLGKVTSNTTVP